MFSLDLLREMREMSFGPFKETKNLFLVNNLS